MAWSNNNLAHVYTNAALVSLKQYKARKFAEVAKIKVRALAFFPGVGASDNIKKVAATAMASMLDGVMNQWIENTQYEENYGATRAIRTMARALVDGDKTVEDVGEAVDQCFFFAGEIHDA